MFEEKVINSNKAVVIGTICEEFTFNHEVYWEKFYSSTISVKRKSGVIDYIPVMVSDRLVSVGDIWNGQRVIISGSFRSYNLKSESDGKSHLMLYLFAREFMPCSVDENDSSELFLDGYLCKGPFYRRTKSGREICEVILAVNRRPGKSDFIPLVCWGRNARFTKMLDIGEHVKIKGRIQSRNFSKKNPNTGLWETRTAYEVSVNKMEVGEEDVEQEED